MHATGNYTYPLDTYLLVFFLVYGIPFYCDIFSIKGNLIQLETELLSKL